MTDLPQTLREDLESRFTLYSTGVSARQEDSDGTVKLRFTLRDGVKVEGVLLTDGGGRRTACISSQAGCAMGCVFCKTGSLGFLRNLDSAEIVEQFLHLRREGAGAGGEGPEIANIVFMGMGEPLLNLPELRRALGILTDPQGLGLSRRRLTLSTAGIIRGIRDLADNGPGIRLAVSLTAADEALRRALMPVTAANPLPRLKAALAYYQEKAGRRITLEAVLLGGINTRPRDAAALADFAQGLDAAVNLIPWNPAEGLSFEGRPLREPAPAEVQDFSRELARRGITVTRRLRKGLNIRGACGQLGELPDMRLDKLV
jgi:23S rRNA (adenine2503-C2)-methyltransferase